MGRSGGAWLCLFLLSFVSGPAWLDAAQPRSERSDERHPITTLLLHQQNLTARASRGLPRLDSAVRKSGPVRRDELFLPDIGDIAVVDDGDGVFLPALPFDLDGKALQFLPTDSAAGAYSYQVREGGYDLSAAANGEFVTLGDDDTRPWALPFVFSFFGRAYEQVFINSDGNLTFGSGDVAQTARDPARSVTGPPRIACLFNDLDPSQPDSAIRVLASEQRLVVTWVNVPEFRFTNDGPLQNFQISLFSDGRIEFAYQGITTNTAVVGIAPGERFAESQAVDFSEPSTATFSAAVVEIFLPADLDLGVLGQKFYLTHDDAYDFLVVFHNYELPLELGNIFALYATIRNSVRGIGPAPAFAQDQNLIDLGALVGSPQRLQGILFMGGLEKYPDDPNGRISRDFGLGLNTPLTVLAHEAGHRFLARVLFVDPESGLLSAELLGRQFSHWSFYFNSEASFLEGNRIVDRGGGPFRFETVQTIERFSLLDQYLMGLIPPEDVPPNFLVRNPSIRDDLFTPAHEPLAGIFFDGRRLEITIDDIIAANGPRSPDHTVSQKNFRYGFVLLKQEGKAIPPADVAKMERFREGFEDFIEQAAGRRMDAETELVRQLGLTTWPAAGVLAGESLPAAVFLAEPASSELAVRLSSDNERIAAPSAVTIPAGSQFVIFDIEGRQPGVARLAAEAGSEFEVAHSNIQVLGSAARLSAQRLLPFEILFGDSRERLRTWRAGSTLPYLMVFQILDQNFLTYANAPVRFEVSGDGSASPETALTDDFGLVFTEWELASAPGENTLAVHVEGSSEPPLVVTYIGVRDTHRQRNLRQEFFGP